MDADRRPRPGLLDFKKVIEPLRIMVADDWSSFSLRNGQDFADTAAFGFRFEVMADGGALDAGTVEVAPVPAQSEAFVQLPEGLPALAAGLPEGQAAVLTVSAVLAADCAWAAAGHEVAWGQSVRQPANPVEPQPFEPVVLSDRELTLGPLVLSRATGTPTSRGGLPVEKLGLSLWWPPTDNDLGREWDGADDRPLAAQWKDARLNLLRTRLLGISAEVHPEGGQALKVHTRVSAAGKQYGVFVDFTWTTDGEAVALRTGVRPDGEWVNRGFEVEWARIGLELVLADGTESVSWCGKGPHQSYPDTGQGARMGWFSLPLAEMDVDYVRPQECGARSGVRSVAVRLGAVQLEISGAPFALTVRPYSQDVLDAAAHRPDLKADGRSYVYLDHAPRGVGTAACGPGVLERYRLKPQEAGFTLSLRVPK
ncbi:beta-galactosidase domain 4-containing protein [Pseudarthrobacter sp. NamB4]|uniref:beta-galactosidase domain 4-containing protein n=1 Tax=Pseudarthrobacter sp. NamB4 TaxID=2576837 RepID=UPI001F0DA34E|nr:beta-galactosidase domain 4-containing protein [Pseudarthrobacter sp. NamB4]